MDVISADHTQHASDEGPCPKDATKGLGHCKFRAQFDGLIMMAPAPVPFPIVHDSMPDGWELNSPTSGLRLKRAIWNFTGEKKPIHTAGQSDKSRSEDTTSFTKMRSWVLPCSPVEEGVLT